MKHSPWSAAAWLVALLLVACGSGTSHPSSAVDVVPTDLSPGDHHFTVDGHELAFHVAGRGPVCLAEPGGPGAEWRYLKMPEVEQSLTLVYVEPVGTGASGRLAHPNDYSHARYVRDLDALREHLGLSKVCVLGHSAGGLTALAYAVAHGDRLSGLILYGTAAALDDAWARDMRANMHWFDGRSWLPRARAAMDEFWRSPDDAAATRAMHDIGPMYFADFDALDPAVRERLHTLRVWAAPAVARGPRFDVTRQLHDIHAPTLVVVGRRDFVMSPVSAERIHAGIPGSQIAIIEGAGHMAHLEKPAEFAAAIAAFAPSIRAN